MITPEQRARENIDRQLAQAGWLIQDLKDFNPSAGLGIAVREYPTESGAADYILFVDSGEPFLRKKPVGVIEAKREGHTLSQVHDQTTRYSADKLKYIRKDELLPFQYESTGTETLFTDARDPHPRQREIFNFHKPETLHEWLKQEETLRARLKRFPTLSSNGLRVCQFNAIINLENSFAQNKPRALVQMATGAGKTYTAITSVYRLLKFAKAKKILFLVDTRNLGKQAEQEFRAYKPVDDKRLFPELYTIQRLQSNFIDPSAQVCISTIQRMYSILKGKELDESLEDDSPYESKTIDKPVDVAYTPNIPIETFDFIIIDECHRSIYNLWKQVLDYFDCFMIGLTATPDKRTFAFFHENIVSEYTLKQSITDKVNVGYDVYTIETEVTQQGAKIKAKQYVNLRNKTTRKKEWKQLDDEVTYAPTQLDRDIVNPSQIRNIIRECKRVMQDEFYPERDENYEVPKTLIFAKTDSHAEDIVHIVREEFGEDNEFCKKITYNVKNEDPESILQQFRTSYNPRIAVTVDMIATGTDVKPIEVLIFMRDVRSRNYFQQMIGRGTRSFSRDELVKVTPSAKLNKERFYIIDAVGVFKSVKVDYPVVDKKPSVPLKDLMKMVILQPEEDVLSSLAARLTKMDKQISEEDRKKIKELTGGKDLTEVAVNLANVYDPDTIDERAREVYKIPDEAGPDEKQVKETIEQFSSEAIKPFDNPKLREFLETVRQKIYQIIDETNPDRIVRSEFDTTAKENSEEIINNFRKFIDDNKDEIIALKIFFALKTLRHPESTKGHPEFISGSSSISESEKLKQVQLDKYTLNYKIIKELRDALMSPPYLLTVEQIWRAYERSEPKRVKHRTTIGMLTDIISLIRFEIGIDKDLEPYSEIINRKFKEWVFKRNAGPVQFTEEQMEWLRMIKDHIISSVRIEKDDFELSPFVDQGGLGKFYQVFGNESEVILNEINENFDH
ncbi:MAG TPA: type I restriction-modification enzyme R subunit C-terminal domain-containing protein [Ignavibacteriaceae bacterium]|nr:MAG: Type-1 restriction enzyme R protein [Ignavibacteria bacterium ADurb.Bin266]HQI39791.1 type I restriction-modification enzyme R subunit C-terminal domain-containing protein [Ignavibacteriaceae bacterium]